MKVRIELMVDFPNYRMVEFEENRDETIVLTGNGGKAYDANETVVDQIKLLDKMYGEARTYLIGQLPGSVGRQYATEEGDK